MVDLYANPDLDSQEDVEVAEKTSKSNHLILFNDDFNTFEFVIDSLIEVCELDVIQAEQCTWIIHNNGKCAVKDGSRKELKPLCQALLDRDLTAEIH